MEEGQRQQNHPGKGHPKVVLILVVMEEGQRPSLLHFFMAAILRLNPCCNGRGSKTITEGTEKKFAVVLILVVMEEGQRPH